MPIGESDSAIAENMCSSLGGGGGARVGDDGMIGSAVGTYAPEMSSSCGKLSVVEDMLVEMFVIQCHTSAPALVFNGRCGWGSRAALS